VIEAIPAFLDRWGTHPSWSRMLGSPALYRQIETRLTELLGAADSLLLPTLTHIHASVIPVVGERDRSEISPFGRRGNGVVRHLGERYDHVVLTGGFSKAYSSLLAFIACPPELKRLLKVTAPPYLYSGPSPVASLASVLVGLQVNEARGTTSGPCCGRGPSASSTTWAGWGHSPSTAPGSRSSRCPGRPRRPGQGRPVPARPGIYVILAFYPGVPRDEVGFRIQVTAANTDEQVTERLAALDRLADVGSLRRV
jgi:8-amino-7-oxononanoate synthase